MLNNKTSQFSKEAYIFWPAAHIFRRTDNSWPWNHDTGGKLLVAHKFRAHKDASNNGNGFDFDTDLSTLNL